MRITTTSDKRLKALIADPAARQIKGLDKQQLERVRDMLTAIRTLSHPLQLRDRATWRAHELTPGQPGRWSLTINANFRLTFRVDLERQEVSELRIEDYH